MASNKQSKGASVYVNSIAVAFKSDMDLVVGLDASKGIIKYGKNNSYPDYEHYLYESQPQHFGIVNGKAKYLTGLGVKGSTPQAEEWLKRANPKESWEDLREKYLKDHVIYGWRMIKIVPSMAGVPLWYFHIEAAKARVSSCLTKLKFSDNWTRKSYGYGFNDNEITEFPIWYPGCKEVAIYLYKEYNASPRKIEAVYPALEYKSGLKDIDTLVRTQNSRNSLVINDFTAGTFTTIFSGKSYTAEQEKAIAEKINGKHAGDENMGKNIVTFTDVDGKAAEVNVIPTNGLDKKYLEVNAAAVRNVFSAHNAPAELFNYLADSTSVFDRSKIVDQNEWFMNAYVLPGQKPEIKMFKELFKISKGMEADFEIEQFKPIGLDRTNPNVSKYFTDDEVRESLGLPPKEQSIDNNATKVIDAINSLSPLVANKVLESMSADEIRSLIGLSQGPAVVNPLAPGAPLPSVMPVKQVEVNEHLKNLTGKQTQGIMRIVRKFTNGEYSEVQASMLLKSGFGLTDQEVKEFLNVQSAPQGQLPIAQRIAFAQQKSWHEALSKKIITIPDEDHILDTKFLTDYKPLTASITDIRNGILNQLKGNPSISIEELARNFNIDPLAAQGEIEWLIGKKFLTDNADGFFPTEKAINKDTSETDVEFYTVYTFGLREGVPGPVILPTSHQFCKDTYAAFKNIRNAITLQEIESLTNEFDTDVFTYKGGFTGIKGTTEVEPFCRHGWFAHTVSRKVKR